MSKLFSYRIKIPQLHLLKCPHHEMVKIRVYVRVSLWRLHSERSNVGKQSCQTTILTIGETRKNPPKKALKTIGLLSRAAGGRHTMKQRLYTEVLYEQSVEMHLHFPIRLHGVVLNWAQGQLYFHFIRLMSDFLLPFIRCRIPGRVLNEKKKYAPGFEPCMISIMMGWSLDWLGRQLSRQDNRSRDTEQGSYVMRTFYDCSNNGIRVRLTLHLTVKVRLGVQPLRDSWPDFGVHARMLRLCHGAFSLAKGRVCHVTGHSPCLCQANIQTRLYTRRVLLAISTEWTYYAKQRPSTFYLRNHSTNFDESG
jgi:hypothetical protein